MGNLLENDKGADSCEHAVNDRIWYVVGYDAEPEKAEDKLENTGKHECNALLNRLRAYKIHSARVQGEGGNRSILILSAFDSSLLTVEPLSNAGCRMNDWFAMKRGNCGYRFQHRGWLKLFDDVR